MEESASTHAKTTDPEHYTCTQALGWCRSNSYLAVKKPWRAIRCGDVAASEPSKENAPASSAPLPLPFPSSTERASNGQRFQTQTGGNSGRERAVIPRATVGESRGADDGGDGGVSPGEQPVNPAAAAGESDEAMARGERGV